MNKLGVVFAAIAMTIVGSSVAAASVIVDYPIMGGQAVRYAVASLVLFIWARVVAKPIPRPSARDLGWLGAVALTGMAAFNVLLIAATARADPSLVGAIVGTAPVALAILGALQERRSPSGGLVFAAVVVALGAAVVQQARLVGDTVGVLLAVGAMFGEVGFSLFAVPVLRRIGPVAVSAHCTWLAAAMLAAGALVVEGSDALRFPTATEAIALAYLALVVTAAAFVIWYSAVDRLGADTAGLFAGLIPVSALATSALIGTDQMTPIKLVGALIVGAGVVIGLGTRRRGRWVDAHQSV
jgi:drug/metabolite transporter (DMT)-like permease